MIKMQILIIFLWSIVFVKCSMPDYIKRCKADDPAISKCILAAINELRPRLRVGIPELEVPPMDPFRVDAVHLTHGVQCNFTDIEVFGGSTFEIIELQINITELKLWAAVRLPFTQVKSHYEVNAQMLSLNVRGSGTMYANLTDYNYTAAFNGKRVQENGEERLKFDKVKLILSPGPTTMQIDNLFSGNIEMSKMVNEVLKNSLGDIFEVVRPAVTETLSTLFTDIANKITTSVKYDEIFL